MTASKPLLSHPFGLVALFGGIIGLMLLASTQGAADRYLPHGVCYAWQPSLIRLHLVSDVLIGLAYLAIPIALVHFIRARTDLPFNWMFLLFGLFIVACGATHWMEVWTLWNPTYWLAGSVKAVTAAASVPTAILLFLLIPKALALPSIAQLEAAKAELEREVSQRRQAEAALEESRRQLEVRVEERTSELRSVNALLEQQRADLDNANRAKSDFLAILSHELRNPIHAIRTSAWVIKAQGEDGPRQQAAGAIDRQVAKLSVLLEELLDVVSVSRATRLRLERADLRTIVDAAVETARPDFVARKQTLSVSRSQDELPIDADPSRLEQAIVNILNNASKYTPDGGRIDVAVACSAENATVTIRDNGVGISAGDVSKLFQLFSRGRAASTATSDGLGVGLYIAHGLVVAHKGTITARSAGLGEGSEFVVRLPLAAAATSAGKLSPSAAVDAPSQATKLRILVVDDNRDAADSLAKVLVISGHEVMTTYEGEGAIELARRNKPDVALVDIGLPTVSGYDVARTLGEDSARPVMIAITGWGAEDDKAKARRAGFAHHLTKPVDIAALVALIDDIAARRSRPVSA